MKNKSWNKGWDKVFSENTWGKYPSEPLVRFVGSNYKDLFKNSNMKVLEIGCGTGANLWFLCNSKFKTYGIDGSSIAISQAKKNMKKHRVKPKLFTQDIIELPFRDNYFDLVLDIECLYSNSEEKLKTIMSEIYRVMKPNSRFFSLSFSTRTSGYKSGKKYNKERHTFTNLKKGPFKKNYGIIRFMDQIAIKRLYKIFKIEKIEKVSRTYNNLNNMIEEWVILSNK